MIARVVRTPCWCASSRALALPCRLSMPTSSAKRAAVARPCAEEGETRLSKRSRRALSTQAADLHAAAAPTSVEAEEASTPDYDWLIVGLGNPGGNYANTRHNIGFMVVDALAALEGIDCRKLHKSAAVGRGQLQGSKMDPPRQFLTGICLPLARPAPPPLPPLSLARSIYGSIRTRHVCNNELRGSNLLLKVLLVKPMTFMNNSGESVLALSREHRVPPSKILVITDDLDQQTAVVKLKPKGGHGGHNGLRSIIDCLGTSAFPRLKVGIGRPPALVPVPTYVLEDFTDSEQEAVKAAVGGCVDIVRSVVGVGLEKAVSGVRVTASSKSVPTLA